MPREHVPHACELRALTTLARKPRDTRGAPDSHHSLIILTAFPHIEPDGALKLALPSLCMLRTLHRLADLREGKRVSTLDLDPHQHYNSPRRQS